MLEMVNTPLKKMAIGILIAIVFGSVYFTIRNNDNKMGACLSCCTVTGTKVCKPNFSRALCREYNQRGVEGRSWEFVESPQGKCPN